MNDEPMERQDRRSQLVLPERTPVQPFDLVIFGASGDLALRKLYPAMAHRDAEGVIPPGSHVLAVVHQEAHKEILPARIAARLEQEGLDQAAIGRFMARVSIVVADAHDPASFAGLASELQGSPRVSAIYLSTAPDLFVPIAQNLAGRGLLEGEARLILEKPIGRDLASACAINNAVSAVIPETRTYRIDHYLGKETVQNLLVLRFANTLFERSWSSRDIDHVQITVAETVGLEARAGYYDEVGALRDMVQNHVLQLLCLFASEPPNHLAADAVRDEKLRVLRALRPIAGTDVARFTVRGQYAHGSINGVSVPGYGEELGHPSDTETFVALRCEVDNWRWAGVPFYLRTGKRLGVRSSEIVVVFKPVPHSIFSRVAPEELESNRLVLRLQPNDGLQLHMMMKVPGSGRLKLVPRTLDLRYDTAFGFRAPDAYERLLTDVIRGDQTLFMRCDEVEAAWSWIDPIVEGWQEHRSRPFRYTAGTWGPSQAIGLIERDGRSWVEPEGT